MAVPNPYPSAEAERSAVIAREEARVARDEAAAEALLTQLEAGQDEPLKEDFITGWVRQELEYRHFDTKPEFYDSSSAELVDVSKIDGGVAPTPSS